ncbi:MAG: ATP-binding protein [Caldilineaceae bacterium]|uniref:histidine kinase n=1 Tax=Caldilineaceae bacterium SB0675_bin_29 TaxID=2605266 RepID=A0A6B1FYL3_9CHLR|nr:ATP-binding protein [Caldilineaceae bacterium]MYH61118.1 HAMP domain-containing protein [Caldilineaceae bacterium SB0675_bin_29]
MNTTTLSPSPSSPSIRFLLGVIVTVLGGLLLFRAVLSPPTEEIWAMAQFLTATALLSVVAVYLTYRLGWLHYSPRLSWTLLGGYGFASLLTFINVFVTARLMFASDHDLRLAAVLLIFAGGIATALGYFLSTTLSEKIQWVGRAAAAIAEGRRDVRVDVVGNDELAHLGKTFNQMAARLEAAESRHRETEQMRRNLLAWIGHDLRTPLASIQALVEALTDGYITDPNETQRYLRTIQLDAAALSVLIDELFEMAEIEAGGLQLDRQPISLSDLISDTLESFAVQAEEMGIGLSGSADPRVDPVMLDAGLIGRVLTNLIGNALRHTPPGGSVAVSAQGVMGGVRVDVFDSGPGIPDESLSKVFEQFYRVEQSRSRARGGGSGLGLTIAKAVVEAHNGVIGVENRAEGGARFYFVLPNR